MFRHGIWIWISRLTLFFCIRQGQPKYFTNDDHNNPNIVPIPRFWVPKNEVLNRIYEYWKNEWFIGWRRVSIVTNERTFLPILVPLSGIGDSIFLIFPQNSNIHDLISLFGNINSPIFDYFCRQKMGGVNINYFILEQLPCLNIFYYKRAYKVAKKRFNYQYFIIQRIIELIYTSNDMSVIARECGYDSLPVRWDEKRRFFIRCELDAVYFHLYLSTIDDWQKGSQELLNHFPSPRDAVDYIMETFPIVKRKDEKKYGEYRTKQVIMEIYDKMIEAIKTGHPYQTILDPPPEELNINDKGD